MTNHIIFEMSKEAKRVKGFDRNRKKNQGSNWIWRGTRKVIYWAASHRCVWCNKSSEEDGVELSLDHIVPNAYGGSNLKGNLVTCCTRCNSVRGDKLIPQWLKYMEENLDFSSEEVAEAQARLFKSFDAHTTTRWNEHRKAAIAAGYLVKTPKGYR